MKHKTGYLFNLFVMLSMLAGMIATPALAAAGNQPEAQPQPLALKSVEKPNLDKDVPADKTLASCALLDDAKVRGKMSAMFESALLRKCGRQSELGGSPAQAELRSVQQAAAVDVLVNNPATDSGLALTQSETSLARSSTLASTSARPPMGTR